MEDLVKNLGIILVLLGVVGLVVYAVKLPENWLLGTSLGLEAAGIITYIIINRLKQ